MGIKTNAITFAAVIIFSSQTAFASTAGENTYDISGNLEPIMDPAIAPDNIMTSNVEMLQKRIEIDLSEQTLSYYYGHHYKVDEFKISSGLPKTPTPTGEFEIKDKIPVKAYRGRDYYLPNTLWNLKFIDSGYYIHGAYWHNNFGQPMSHGCINVPYSEMENLYVFADIGTKVIIKK
ncbi:MAG: ErfK/YbiS/YcfS/YnhG family protein [Candidatus Yanofskybacteria bacterium GW2011_GWA1_44_21]|uniref:ErfK/YbiS/YcfS/YnhG family protein n=1 Tax=Candidatus Yanofskybacteria bacterium GW2011_GWB1_45_11 TaxID=1619026 RepID=A0A0G1L3C1_9BACT|nr:MAG: ErfK/YbiS/YcfS/YnhG family protein [Candidatus Yanofskybacteria bacterium GW2011_GWA2_44_10]KKT50879.1 MAG: ErfK/YbiS/YcfS/YnhG family protein [Candidatus Yanofskybacteria bacterium GW2011_GWA1_44_21]KKT90451.1 MAG: ErfK/YbiS/YcfS/YnhG family protein [Candidatus Yanofskybacteria bacterium GW2011_GWB1_45_11]